jgi:hypothetical protein
MLNKVGLNCKLVQLNTLILFDKIISVVFTDYVKYGIFSY